MGNTKPEWQGATYPAMHPIPNLHASVRCNRLLHAASSCSRWTERSILLAPSDERRVRVIDRSCMLRCRASQTPSRMPSTL